DARLKLFLRVALGRVTDEPLLVGELLVEVEGIRPVERQDGRLAHVKSPHLLGEAALLAALSLLRHPAAAEALLEREPDPYVVVAEAVIEHARLAGRPVGEELQ